MALGLLTAAGMLCNRGVISEIDNTLSDKKSAPIIATLAAGLPKRSSFRRLLLLVLQKLLSDLLGEFP